MPRVSEDHTARRRAQILDAARRVCLSRPVFHVTMRDIVLESGMSQGGVYRYFQNIDQIFVALLLQDGRLARLEASVHACLEESQPPAQAVRKVLHLIGRSLEEAIRGDGKILLELAILYSGEPARFLQIREEVMGCMSMEGIWRALAAFIEGRAAACGCRLQLQVNDLVVLIETCFDGLVQQALLADRLASVAGLPQGGALEQRVEALAQAVTGLLGGDMTS